MAARTEDRAGRRALRDPHRDLVQDEHRGRSRGVPETFLTGTTGRLALAAAAALGIGLGRPVPPAAGACPHPYPGGVIDCLEAAYAARDTALYAAILAPDFRFTGADSGAGWDRDEDLRGIATLFASADSIAFEITGPITVMDGPAPGLVVLDRVPTALTVIFDKPEGKTGWREEEVSTFTVREVPGPESGYEIVEWRQLGGD